MIDVLPDADYVMTCLFEGFSEVRDPHDAAALVPMSAKLKSYYGWDVHADVARMIRWLVSDPDSNLSAYATPSQLEDGGAHLRGCLTTIATSWGVYLNVEVEEAEAVRRWFLDHKPIQELIELTLVSFERIAPERRGEVILEAFSHSPLLNRVDMQGLASAVTKLATGEFTTKAFEGYVGFLLRHRTVRQ